MSEYREKNMLPLEKEILENLDDDALANRLINDHCYLNLYIFYYHKGKKLGRNNSNDFRTLIPRVANRNYFIQLKAERIDHLCKKCSGNCQLRCKTVKGFIYDISDAKKEISKFLKSLRQNGDLLLESLRPVCRQTVSDSINGNSIPKFDTLMTIGLMYGYRISISICDR